MSASDYRKRLEALNGGPLAYQREAKPDVEEIRRLLERKRDARPRPAPEPIHYLRNLPRSEPKSASPGISGRSIVLEEALPGEEISIHAYGQAYLIESASGMPEGEWGELGAAFQEEFTEPESPLQRHLAGCCPGGPFFPQEVLVIDVESTGLGHSPLFLIGTLGWEEGALCVRQYLARTYAEEAAVTAAFLDDARAKKLLVSFNGKSFDVPYIRARAAACGIPYTLDAAHFDLLHTARRLWRATLPDCRLQTLERHLCARVRHDDIPGADIPEAYHAYVRTGNAVQMVQIIKHNMLDLLTLAELMTRLQ